MKTDAANAAVQTKIDNLLTNMITVSDNESCNELGRLQSEKHDFLDGAEKVNEYLEKEGYSETSYQSTLHPSSSAKISLGGRNMTSVKDCGLLLERIYRGECVSEEASAQMLDLLKRQENTSKILQGSRQKFRQQTRQARQMRTSMISRSCTEQRPHTFSV